MTTGSLTTEPGRRQMFAMLRLWNGRLFIASQFLYSISWWTSRIAIDWLALQLTGDLALVGLAITLQLVPSLVFSVWAGILADRYTRRSVLMVAQGLTALCFGALAVLVLLDLVQVWHVFAACLVSGVALALDGPSRLAFLPEVVGLGALRHALSLNAIAINMGGLIAPVVGGAVIALVGTGWALGASALVGLVVVASLSLIRRRELVDTTTVGRESGQLREAFRYCLARPTILWPLLLIGVVSAFGYALSVLFAGAATEEGFDSGSGGYGLYTSLAAVGAMIGAVIMGGRLTLRLRGIVFASGLVGLTAVAAGLATWEPLFLAVLVAIGAARTSLLIGAETMTQLSTKGAIRGRVMSIYFLTAVIGQSAGSLLLGGLAQWIGLTPSFLIAGGAMIVIAIVAAISLARRHKLGLRFRLRPAPAVLIVRRTEEF